MTDREQAVLSKVPTGLFIGGAWRDAASGSRFDVHDPATGAILTTVADATPEDGKDALSAAAGAQESWAQTPPRARGELLRSAYEAIMARIDDLALLMTLEMGKSVTESRAEITYAADFFRWFSEEAVRIFGRYSVAPAGGSRVLTMKQPVGPSLFITPWNFPMAMGTRKIGPAVAAGCTMVVKPASETPLSMLMLASILADVGLPDGVLNVIPTTSAGAVSEPLIRDPRLRKLSFTGSTQVGRKLIEQSAQQVLRVSMELGGNAPFLVFEDADLDAAVEGAVLAKMRNVGEACTAANRFHVHESVSDEFASRLASRLSALRVGRGTEDGVEVGPLISENQRETVESLLSDAVERGGRVLAGGSRVDGPGYFFQPTVVGDVPPGSRILSEEVFGPVAPVATFKTDDDALAQANNTEYGLVSYVYTRDIQRALWVCERLESGMVGLNAGIVSNVAAPFGGVKASGVGREGGFEGIEEFLETRYVSVSLPLP